MNYAAAVKGEVTTPIVITQPPPPQKKTPTPPQEEEDFVNNDEDYNDDKGDELNDVTNDLTNDGENNNTIETDDNENVVYYIGYFDALFHSKGGKDENIAVCLVKHLGPVGTCLLGITCRYFYNLLLGSPIGYWNLVEKEVPQEINVTVNFMIDISPVDDKDGKGPVEEKITSVPLSQVKSEYQKSQLVRFWLRTVSRAHALREKQLEEAKANDPLAANEKVPLKAVLAGGFVIDTVDTKKNLVKLNDLGKVHSWLEALETLLSGKSKSIKIPHNGGNIILTRIGRGGSQLSLRVRIQGGDDKYAVLDFGYFANAIRKAGKEYLTVVGSCRNKLRKTQPNQPQTYTEKEKFILGLLGHDHLYSILETIKSHLSSGAVPRSTLPDYFKRKEEAKTTRKEQESSETDSIVDFIEENLPPSWEQTLKAKNSLEFKLRKAAERELEERNSRFEKLRREKEAQKAALKAELEKRNSEKAEKKKGKEKTVAVDKWEEPEKKKIKTKDIKVTDKDGFTTTKKVYEEGGVLVEMKVESKIIEIPVQKKKQVDPNVAGYGDNPYLATLMEDADEKKKTEQKPKPKEKEATKSKSKKVEKSAQPPQQEQPKKVAPSEEKKVISETKPAPTPSPKPTTVENTKQSAGAEKKSSKTNEPQPPTPQKQKQPQPQPQAQSQTQTQPQKQKQQQQQQKKNKSESTSKSATSSKSEPTPKKLGKNEPEATSSKNKQPKKTTKPDQTPIPIYQQHFTTIVGVLVVLFAVVLMYFLTLS